MKNEALPRLQPQNRQRNQRIASILTLLLTFASKIQKIKEKLCGFSSKEFSPEGVFEALDLTNKGYLDLYDVRQFLSNDRINDQDILKLFMRFGATDRQPRLTFHGYLQLLRPHFSSELGRDLLIRDTLSNHLAGSDKPLRENQQTILLLLNELILLNCICVAEHQEMKEALMEEYMLNQLELSDILGLNRSRAPLKSLFEFIDSNSDYQVHENEVKFLLAYLRVPEFRLSQQLVIAGLLLPTRLNLSGEQQRQTENKTNYLSRELNNMHSSYDKVFIGKNDLLNGTQKFSFLNYVHPNSYQHPKVSTKPQEKLNKRAERDVQEEGVGTEHGELDVFNDQRMKNSIKKFKKVGEADRLEESLVQSNNIYRSQAPVQLITSSQVPIHTPVLEQFMRDSNIKVNMGQYSSARPNQLAVMFQQSIHSHMSESEAFERGPMGKPNTLNVPSRQQPLPQMRANFEQESEWRPRMEVSNKMKTSEVGGILDQFMRVDF